MRLKKNLPPRKLSVMLLVVVISPLFLAQGYSLQLTDTSEYNNYVHYVDSGTTGRYVVIDKPIFPVLIEEGAIPIGENLTIICPLQEGHKYHVYIYGNWVNMSSAAKTDYDIYVYNPQGSLESSHTEAAGFPEHLGTTTDDSLFTPKQSGNYSFVIKNDPRESQGAQQATFAVFENLECNKWYTSHVNGKGTNNLPNFYTCWAYEFVTNETKVELYANIPETLDMYEIRLYLMNDAKSPSINSFPLPWEAGLYTNKTDSVGGYNFENEGYRGVAYASCEYMGQDMFLTYTSANKGMKLYHLVLIGEEGSGDVEFMLKTTFSTSTLSPLVTAQRVLPGKPTNISYIYNSNATLQKAQLSYTIDGWKENNTLDMAISNQTCNTTIPGQVAGSLVEYELFVEDVLRNNANVSGSYYVKEQSFIDVFLAKDKIRLGENITVTGALQPVSNGSSVVFTVFSSNDTKKINCHVSSDGIFTLELCPSTSGPWSLVADSAETQTCWGCTSDQLLVIVEEPPLYIQYQLYIIIGLVGALAAGGAVYYLKFRQ